LLILVVILPPLLYNPCYVAMAMRIWTIPEFSGLFPEGEPLMFLPGSEIKDAFLSNALAGDMAVLGLDADYMDFLSALKARGAGGPVVFISTGPVVRQENLAPYNAIILDEERLGKEGLRTFVGFIVRVARGNIPKGSNDAPRPRIPLNSMPDERPAEGSLDVKEVLSYNRKRAIPVVVALQLIKDSEPFTARGVCEIKEIGDKAMVLHRFKPSMLLRELRLVPMVEVHSLSAAGGSRHHQLRLHHQMFAVFTYKGDTYETLLSIIDADSEALRASIPERLVRERRRHVRVEPDPEEPVELYMLVEGEPTARLRVTDISRQGTGFICERDLRVGEVYSFAIVLPEPKAVVQSHGVVRFKKEFKDAFRYGVEFRAHPGDEELLVRYINKRESDILRLLRER
jgi:hypothetical protein